MTPLATPESGLHDGNENQIGFTFGGPLTLPLFGDGGDLHVWKGTDKTFIFGDYQRWSDRSLVSGPTLTERRPLLGEPYCNQSSAIVLKFRLF